MNKFHRLATYTANIRSWAYPNPVRPDTGRIGRYIGRISD